MYPREPRVAGRRKRPLGHLRARDGRTFRRGTLRGVRSRHGPDRTGEEDPARRRPAQRVGRGRPGGRLTLFLKNYFKQSYEPNNPKQNHKRIRGQSMSVRLSAFLVSVQYSKPVIVEGMLLNFQQP